MRAAKSEAARFQQSFKDAGSKTEDALKEAGNAVKEVFQNIKFGRPGWFGQNNNGQASAGEDTYQEGFFNRQRTPPGGSPDSAPPLLPAATSSSQPAHAPAAATPQEVPPPPQRLVAAANDAAMQQRLVSLERLVSMGLSPQAARAALQHLDEWLVSDVGAAEMSTAEATAQAAGEYILHIGDRVCLDGLVKNASANGTSGLLQQYVAESQRWKVVLDNGKTYLLQSKFLQPSETHRDSKLDQLKKQAKIRCLQSETVEGDAAALASGWKSLEASQAAWKEAQQVMQVKILEREEALRKAQEELERQQQQLGEHRRSIALDQARGLAEIEQRSAMLQLPDNRRPSAHFEMANDDSPAKSCSTADPVQEMATEDDDDDEGEGEDADEVWDMDWSAVAQQSAGSPVEDDAPPIQDIASPVSNGDATPAVAPEAAASTAAPADAPAAAEAPLLPAPAPSELEELQRKLEEKRRLAELHNGEDHTAAPRGALAKESMPGAHPSLAEKLEQRRKNLEAAPHATLDAAPPDQVAVEASEGAADEAF